MGENNGGLAGSYAGLFNEGQPTAPLVTPVAPATASEAVEAPAKKRGRKPKAEGGKNDNHVDIYREQGEKLNAGLDDTNWGIYSNDLIFISFVGTPTKQGSYSSKNSEQRQACLHTLGFLFRVNEAATRDEIYVPRIENSVDSQSIYKDGIAGKNITWVAVKKGEKVALTYVEAALLAAQPEYGMSFAAEVPDAATGSIKIVPNGFEIGGKFSQLDKGKTKFPSVSPITVGEAEVLLPLKAHQIACFNKNPNNPTKTVTKKVKQGDQQVETTATEPNYQNDDGSWNWTDSVFKDAFASYFVEKRRSVTGRGGASGAVKTPADKAKEARDKRRNLQAAMYNIINSVADANQKNNLRMPGAVAPVKTSDQ